MFRDVVISEDQVVLSSTLAVFILFMVASSFLIVMAFKVRHTDACTHAYMHALTHAHTHARNKKQTCILK